MGECNRTTTFRHYHFLVNICIMYTYWGPHNQHRHYFPGQLVLSVLQQDQPWTVFWIYYFRCLAGSWVFVEHTFSSLALEKHTFSSLALEKHTFSSLALEKHTFSSLVRVTLEHFSILYYDNFKQLMCY
jgi:hypothetical protein